MSNLVHVKGLSELQKFLDELPSKMEARIMRGAVRAGAVVLLNEAKAHVPVKHGDLRDSLRISTRSRRGTVTATVKSDLYYAKWIEYGTAAHLIKVDEKDKPTRITRHGLKKYSMKTINKMVARGSLVIGGHFIGPVVRHPGAAPKPFMRPALDNAGAQAVVAAGQYIKARLTKQGIEGAADVEVGEA